MRCFMFNWFINLNYVYQALIATLFTYLLTALGAGIVFFFSQADKFAVRTADAVNNAKNFLMFIFTSSYVVMVYFSPAAVSNTITPSSIWEFTLFLSHKILAVQLVLIRHTPPQWEITTADFSLHFCQCIFISNPPLALSPRTEPSLQSSGKAGSRVIVPAVLCRRASAMAAVPPIFPSIRKEGSLFIRLGYVEWVISFFRF